MFQYTLGLVIEITDIAGGRLDLFPSEMEFAELRDNVTDNCTGCASARVVWQPPSVRGPYQMMRNDDWSLYVWKLG